MVFSEFSVSCSVSFDGFSLIHGVFFVFSCLWVSVFCFFVFHFFCFFPYVVVFSSVYIRGFNMSAQMVS